MLQQIQEHTGLLAFILLLALYLIIRKLNSGAMSERASIIRCNFEPSEMALFFPGVSITRMSGGMEVQAVPAGTLRMAVGRNSPLVDIPQKVDVKLLIIDENKKVFEASKQLFVRQDDIIGLIEVPIPIKPYEKEFICKAWIVAAYYEDGSTWTNDNASAHEVKNRKFIECKLAKIN